MLRHTSPPIRTQRDNYGATGNVNTGAVGTRNPQHNSDKDNPPARYYGANATGRTLEGPTGALR
jgi:hypothetical protein